MPRCFRRVHGEVGFALFFEGAFKVNGPDHQDDVDDISLLEIPRA